ncbi:tRNA glutamyl-Q(34) synthetase GluQRS [Acidithiobacillus thiooxidans]|uniref:tRNA glutamyl-Q(34) synthetase GluQRS n=1 Tax=Acidithiobacillus thiooxidans TaxID=930 RepID=UPI001D025EA9|nr:tRNA glutamyl-Q(34) synthetase GluQRS [Acidithiobacillus thiooxidans]
MESARIHQAMSSLSPPTMPQAQARKKPVVGRFAPSPSGPLHAGSLIAAIGSYLSARSQSGLWLLRMEDVDGDRVRPGAADTILRQLEALGLDWDGPICWQSQRHDYYQQTLDHLIKEGDAYPCACTRQEIRQHGGNYPGTCRHGLAAGRTARSWRLRVPEQFPVWKDRFHGLQNTPPEQGDPVLLRADNYFAYLLACVVDDGAQGVSEVIRGGDLRTFTGVQRYLQSLLHLPRTEYGHLPLLCNADGSKLSKSSQSPAWTGSPGQGWETTLGLLGWDTPAELHGASAEQWRNWALAEARGKTPFWHPPATSVTLPL